MKIGDKVRFLNTKGGGIVKGFKSKEIALVEDEDGFDIPILIRECVVIEPDNLQVRQSVKMENKVQSYVIESKIDDEPISIKETREGEFITACLAFLPIDEKNISTTGYDVYLINDSNYFLSYLYMNRGESGWIKRAVGVVEPNTKVFIEEVNKENLNDLEKICVQFFAYKEDRSFQIKNVCSAEVKIDTVKFYKLHSFKENDYFDNNAIVYTLIRKDVVNKELTIKAEDLEQAMLTKNDLDEKPSKLLKKQNQQDSSILEIDLHIEELLDNTKGLEPADMLDFQLSKFREVMEDNLSNKGKRIVFIHGKGNGVLKKAIINELKSGYKSCYSQDASFKEYGFGATMITIR